MIVIMLSFMAWKWPTQQKGIIRDNVKLEVLMGVAIKITVLWDVHNRIPHP
jgi:hypothetical protein